MKEVTLRKDLVREAASKCPTAKRTLEILCPEFFGEEKPKLEVGKWYMSPNGAIAKPIDNKYCLGLRQGTEWYSHAQWMEGLVNDRGYWTKATPGEIEKALIAEAEKRGFKEGVKFTPVEPNVNDDKVGTIGRLATNTFDYFEYEDGLASGKNWVYKAGKWAEILPSKKKMTLKEVEKELGYEIEITNA